MPLQRDQRNETKAKAPASLPTTNELPALLRREQNNQETRHTGTYDMDKPVKRVNVRTRGSDSGGKHQLEPEGPTSVQPDPNIFRMRPLDTMKIHQAANAQHMGPAKPRESTRRNEPQPPVVKNKMARAQKADTFDDTASLEDSMFDKLQEDEKTMMFRPQTSNQLPEQEDIYADSHEDRWRKNVHGSQAPNTILLEPGWEAKVDEEKRIIAEKHIHTPQARRPQELGMQAGSRAQLPSAPIFENFQEPGTPSRPQSEPQRKAVVPQKIVTWANSNQIADPSSPGYVSSEMAREETLEEPVSRPCSTQPRVHSIPVHLRPQQKSLPQHPSRDIEGFKDSYGRFQTTANRVRDGRQENPKVSAPESDNQDFSEDERAQMPQDYSHSEIPPQATQQGILPTRKRSYNDMTDDLDYSQTDLKQKKLSDLQNEPFPQDPRANPQAPPRDNMGNEMTLNQILDNLSKMSGDAQREVFKTLTDEQWASTGQWFVDKFQAELQKLMEVRLERRKVAMKYEDKIRKRQCEVEYYESQVDKELHELQAGGRQLVDGRKAPSGSRSGTPMKGSR